MPATREQIGAALTNPARTPGEIFVIEWQFSLLGDFGTALVGAIKLADEGNLLRLQRGFPDEVTGFLQWSRGDLAQRLLAEGLDI